MPQQPMSCGELFRGRQSLSTTVIPILQTRPVQTNRVSMRDPIRSAASGVVQAYPSEVHWPHKYMRALGLVSHSISAESC
jgi:hypothetical protein